MSLGRFVLFLLVAGVVGGLSGFLISFYVRPAGATNYVILRDLTTILVVMVSVILALAIAVGSVLIRLVVLREVQGEVEGLIEERRAEVESLIEERRARTLSEFHRVASRLWGTQYEFTQDRTCLVEAVYHGEQAVILSENVGRSTAPELFLRAVNNYMMSMAYLKLAEKAGEDPNRREFNKYISVFEKIVEEGADDDPQQANALRETAYLARASFSEKGSAERQTAVAAFEKLKGDDRYAEWRSRWVKFGLL